MTKGSWKICSFSFRLLISCGFGFGEANVGPEYSKKVDLKISRGPSSRAF